MFIGQDANPNFSNDGTKVVAASTANRDGSHDHQLVQVLGVGELGDDGGVNEAATKDFLHIHFGDSASGVSGVVVVLGVDDEAAENAFHFVGYFVEQFIELARLNEVGNIVVGVKTLTRSLQSFADFDRHRNACVMCLRSHFYLCLFQHVKDTNSRCPIELRSEDKDPA